MPPSNAKWISYIFEAYVKKPMLDDKIILNNYLHTLVDMKFTINIDKKSVSPTIRGNYFCQQNTITSRCVHACVCMLINNLKGSKKITTADINNILTQCDWCGDGVSFDKMKKVLNTWGYEIFEKDYFEEPTIPFNEYVYPFIESKYPSIIFFTTKNLAESHVVNVLGHTINNDLWTGEARMWYSQNTFGPNYYKSSDWVDNFIINDDNFGMYLCLPIDLLKRITLPQYDPFFRVRFSLSIKPKNLQISPAQAERYSMIILTGLIEYINSNKAATITNKWLARILKEKPLLSRTLIVTKEEYKQHLESSVDYDNNKYTPAGVSSIIANLPDSFWLIEVSYQDLYTTNKSKLIDIVYNYDTQITVPLQSIEKVLENCKMIRLPQLTFKDNMLFLNDNTKTVKPNISLNPIISHVKLFKHVESDTVSEW